MGGQIPWLGFLNPSLRTTLHCSCSIDIDFFLSRLPDGACIDKSGRTGWYDKCINIIFIIVTTTWWSPTGEAHNQRYWQASCSSDSRCRRTGWFSKISRIVCLERTLKTFDQVGGLVDGIVDSVKESPMFRERLDRSDDMLIIRGDHKDPMVWEWSSDHDRW